MAAPKLKSRLPYKGLTGDEYVHLKRAEAGVDYVVYEPGNTSLSFLDQRVMHTQYYSSNWAVKLAIICNDALNRRSEELGVDGYVLFSYAAGVSLTKRKQSAIIADTMWQLGPALFFVPAVRPSEDREAWSRASLLEKHHLSSIYWKGQSLDNRSLALPIWTPAIGTLGWSPEGQPERKSPFPLNRTVNEQNVRDTTIDARSGKTLGLFCDRLEGGLVLCDAEEYRARAVIGTRDTSTFYMVKRGKQTPDGKWLRSKILGGTDSVEEFLKAIGEWSDRFPENFMTYQQARSWAPVAAFHVSRYRANTLIPRDTDIEGYHRARVGEEKAEVDLRTPLDRFSSLDPFDVSSSARGMTNPDKRVIYTKEEDEVIKLARKGYTFDELIGYLPQYRTLSSVVVRAPKVNGTKLVHTTYLLPEHENRLIQRYQKQHPVEIDQSKRNRSDEVKAWSREEELFLEWYLEKHTTADEDVDAAQIAEKLLPYFPIGRRLRPLRKRIMESR